MLLDAVFLRLVVPNQRHGQFVLLEEIAVRIVCLSRNCVSESGERVLGDNARVCEPFSIWFYACRRCLSRLVYGSFCDVSNCVTLRFTRLEYIEDFNLLRGANHNMSVVYSLRVTTSAFVPIEVLALDFDVAQATASLALPLFAVGFLLEISHLDL